ncbi:hypothetical protein BCR42DRAFT_412244 [Absidia repens]|uniref:Uncharacterized protein n=1 Tax=Absidia repens TaxID=90262 RepID=A0A1X2IJA7_9FUNG|nr:hypothetical protein BCR42DRAFT_412244 [Absidia repens]
MLVPLLRYNFLQTLLLSIQLSYLFVKGKIKHARVMTTMFPISPFLFLLDYCMLCFTDKHMNLKRKILHNFAALGMWSNFERGFLYLKSSFKTLVHSSDY